MEKLIFVSYNQQDSQFALKLADDLSAKGINIWIDKRNIASGSRWDEEIEKALSASEIFLVILSPASVASENVRDEVSYAIEAHKRVIPVIARQCEIPFRLKRIQYIDFSQDFSGGLSKLQNELLTEFTKTGISADTEKINVPGQTKNGAKKPVGPKYLLIVLGSLAVIIVLFYLFRSGGQDQGSSKGQPPYENNDPGTPSGPSPNEDPGQRSGPIIQGEILVTFSANPNTIPAGEQSDLNVLAFTSQNTPLANAIVKLEMGGGWFASSGTSTEIGQTNQDGVFSTRWRSPKPGAAGYGCTVTVSKEGFKEGRKELTIFINN